MATAINRYARLQQTFQSFAARHPERLGVIVAGLEWVKEGRDRPTQALGYGTDQSRHLLISASASIGFQEPSAPSSAVHGSLAKVPAVTMTTGSSRRTAL